MSVFCDWLTVTTPPGSRLLGDVDALVDELPVSRFSGKDARGAKTEDGLGVLHISETRLFSRVSASGRFLAVLRAVGMFRDYLGTIGDSPHTVTRLDAALDQAVDAAPVIRELHRKYRDGYAFTRKAVSTTTLLQTRFDGAVTGSVYFGNKDSKVQLRAYDKQHEAYAKRGEVLPETLRWELQLSRELGVSLRDAAEPAPVFYRFMSPEFLPCPEGVTAWSANDGGWSVTRPEPRLPAERLARVLDQSADFQRLIELADACGAEGRTYLLGMLRRRLFPDAAQRVA